MLGFVWGFLLLFWVVVVCFFYKKLFVYLLGFLLLPPQSLCLGKSVRFELLNKCSSFVSSLDFPLCTSVILQELTCI